ncbi:hypothetical protein ACLKA7_009878 [Drosophila subpalustris]
MDKHSEMQQQDQRLGHRRQPALGKAMPVTALLLNLNLSQANKASHARAAAAEDEDEPPPRYFSIAEEPQEPPSPNGEDPSEPGHYGTQQQLMGSSTEYTPCLNCNRTAPEHLTTGPNAAINEMCQRLCNAECRRGFSLTGHREMPTQDAQLQHSRKDFLKQFEIAEALAKTSAMTSTTQMKQRLAARKLEMELETQTTATATRLTTPSDLVDSTAAVSPSVAAGDTLPPIADCEMPPPPRDLLLYLVR